MEKKISADGLLSLVEEVCEELHPGYHFSKSVTFDSNLDTDLGLDSLSRMEVVNRIEKRFEVTLSESALTLTETPRDLLRELEKAVGRAIKQPTFKSSELNLREIHGVNRYPQTATTLNEVLTWHAKYNADIPHIRILGENNQSDILTYSDLFTEASNLAAGLLANNLIPGETVLLMLPTGREYFISFFGILLANCIPVPIYPPARPNLLKDHLNRQAKIANNAGVVLMISSEEAVESSKSLLTNVDSLRQISTCENLTKDSSKVILPLPSPQDTAFLQYTSGSTGDPKGVVLSHANLIANIHAMGNFLQVGPDDVFVSWLPLYHDMGLIGAWLGSLTFGIPLVIMNPLTFLARPERWLHTIHRYKGTIAGGPNFAYENCISRIRQQDIIGLDLSSWRIAFNGAETVQPKTLLEFRNRFKSYGFKSNAMMPVYGLAENSVGLAFPPVGRGPVIDRIDKKIFNKSAKALPIDESKTENNVLEVPSCGRPLAGHQIRVVDSAGEEMPERFQGRIQFFGPSSTSGYFRNSDATATLFDGIWRNSGDLGYISKGELYVIGREKDMIIRGGRNIYPAELEAAVGELNGIQQGNVAIFSSPHPDTAADRFVVMAETRRREDEQISELTRSIITLAVELTGSEPDDIVLVAPRSVPKTSSGKVRRHAARALYEKGLKSQSTLRTNLKLKLILFLTSISKHKNSFRAKGNRVYAVYAWTMIAFLAPFSWLGVALIPNLQFRWTFLRATLSALRLLTGVKLKIEGSHYLKTTQPVIIAANHASYIDGAILICSIPEHFHFVAKSELRGNIFSRLFLTRLKTLFTERFDTQQSIRDSDRIADSLREGGDVMFFPEGTFSRRPGLMQFHMGAFTSAFDTGATIVPIVIRGTRSILRDGTIWPRPGLVRVKIFEPIDFESKNFTDRWVASVALRDKVREVILANCGEPDLAAEMVFPEMPGKRGERN